MKDGKYVVKPWKMMEAQYRVDCDGDIPIKGKWFSQDMEEEMPSGRVIEVVDDKWNKYTIIDDMLLGPYFDFLEEIEVSDDGESWTNVRFTQYRLHLPEETNVNRISALSGLSWKYARKLEPKLEINLTLTVNGEEKPLDFLSEETLLKLREGEEK